MPHVVTLYRHPIKGFTPEPVTALTVQADGRVAGDRVLAFRFADAVTPEKSDGLDYWPKSKGLALQDFPALATLRTSYDDAAQRVRIEHDGSLLVDAGLDEDGRAELVAAITDFVLSTREGRRLQRPGRLRSSSSETE
ncbi:MOSC N-terminal beta barrel domain-containing protein [Microbacterium sp. PMB16]|uniref:MOSC N-terminal beta barrel domain-containing protein n=1 Tax=Microbacterium sp. PMB16 TaxID=3120157 RepID=UPI003F4B06D4